MNISENLSTPVNYNCDVLVAGGGFAGISAAVAAARSGRSVILAEKMYMLGGLGTAGLVTIFLPLCDGFGKQVSFGLAEELLRLSISISNDGERGVPNWILSSDKAGRTDKTPRFEVNFNPHFFAISAEQLLLSLGVKILYGTYAVSAFTEDGKIKAAIMENKSGRFGIAAKSFVDATGDADLAKFTGTPTALFNDNILAAWYYYNSANAKFKLRMLGYSDRRSGNPERSITLPDRRFGGIDGEEISEFMQLSHKATMDQVMAEREKDPAFEPCLIASCPQLRMTRRVDGEYTLDSEEQHKFFEDSIGMVSDWRHRGPVYEVPFGTLFSAKTKNLIFAGRCTSVTSAMWDIMRVIPCCCVTGEAAGVAAAMSDDFTSIDIKNLQNELRARGGVIHEKDLE